MNPSSKSSSVHDYQWECGWNQHEQMQLQRLARLPLAQKLAWLEEAHHLAIRLGALPAPPMEDPSPSK
jgi:hypothetical protein